MFSGISAVEAAVTAGGTATVSVRWPTRRATILASPIRGSNRDALCHRLEVVLGRAIVGVQRAELAGKAVGIVEHAPAAPDS